MNDESSDEYDECDDIDFSNESDDSGEYDESDQYDEIYLEKTEKNIDYPPIIPIEDFEKPCLDINAGIANLTNTCNISSALQVIFNLPFIIKSNFKIDKSLYLFKYVQQCEYCQKKTYMHIGDKDITSIKFLPKSF